MILDSSALVAILCREPGHLALIEKLLSSDLVAVGAPTVFEAATVLTIKTGQDGLALAHDFLQESGVLVTPFTQEHTSSAFAAYLRYGKGRHPAALNFGDCLSYAAAKVSGQPLLFVGNGFPKTDVLPA
jgi:ribonuclease VapC